jgi:hypothetical protein
MFGFSLAARRITLAIGAAAIALGTITATALPARANGDDVAKVIAGVTALAIIGSAINNSNRAHATPPVSRAWQQGGNPGWHHDRRGGWHHPKPQPHRGWAPPPRQREACTVWINGRRYVQDSRRCGGGHPRPVPYGYSNR